MKKKKLIADTICFLILLIISLIFITPFLWTFLTSVKPDAEIYTNHMHILPRTISMEHYQKVFTQMTNFGYYFRNSVTSSFWTVFLVTVLSAGMGYSFAKFNYRGKNLVFGFVMLVLTLPYIIYLIPIYIMGSRLKIINTVTGLVLPYIATNLPMAVFIMRGQFMGIPDTLCEAARLDGCSEWQLFARVVLPCVTPGIATVIIYTFINVWGEFTYARTLTQNQLSQTLPVGIVFLQDEASTWAYGTLASVITLSLIPVLIMFLSMQKYFVRGIMQGALKG